MRRVLFGSATLVLMFAAFCASGADWPNFLGPNKDGISSETGINKDWKAKPPKQVWRVPMGDGGYAGPCVAGGKVFIIDHKGAEDVVRAIDLKDGKDAWTFNYPDSAKSNSGFARSTPAVDGDCVYTYSRLGLAYCLKVKDGAKVWEANVVKDYSGRLPNWQLAMSPLIDGDRVVLVVGGANAHLVVLDKKTGKLVWKGGGSDKPGYATPVVARISGKQQYVIFSGTGLVGIAQDDGAVLWRFPWQTQHDVNAAMPIVSGSTVFITSDYGRGCAAVRVRTSGAARIWENKAITSHFSTPVLVDGNLYGTSDPGRLVCLELRSGKVMWEHRGFEKGGLVAVDGTLIVVDGGTGEITMVELSPDGYNELGRMKGLGGQSWTAPIVADGKLVVRNTSALACYELK